MMTFADVVVGLQPTVIPLLVHYPLPPFMNPMWNMTVNVLGSPRLYINKNYMFVFLSNDPYPNIFSLTY